MDKYSRDCALRILRGGEELADFQHDAALAVSVALLAESIRLDESTVRVANMDIASGRIRGTLRERKRISDLEWNIKAKKNAIKSLREIGALIDQCGQSYG